MALTKVIIEILDDDAVDPSRGLTKTLTAQLNPTELSLTKGAQIAEIAIPGIDTPLLQFVRGQNEKLTLELFFDSTEDGMGEGATDVRERTEPFYQLVKIQPKTHAPPRVRFTWGQGVSMTAIVESVSRKFNLFAPDGVPLRATLALTLREYKTLEDQLAELNLQSSDHTRRHVVERGETLSGIAARLYRDPREWRRIADANPAVAADPTRLAPGTTLEIPPLDAFADRRLER